MATYKVIQDIEAEDKFLGPLTLKQFIFGAGAVLFSYLSFIAVAKGVAILLVLLIPPAIVGVFLAIPWSSQQSTEVWALAKLRFHLKPRARIWDQSGLEELVTITVPKKIEKQLTNGLDPTEVSSRLKALAETIDSRGWAVKNATAQQAYTPSFTQDSNGDRLVDIATLPRPVPETDVNQVKDMLDEDDAVSTKFQHMIRESSQHILQESLDKMDRIRQGEPLESIKQPEVNFTPSPAAETPVPASPAQNMIDEKTLSQQLRNKRSAGDLAYNHMQTISPVSQVGSSSPKSPVHQPTDKPQATMTNTPDPAIIELAQNNDLNIQTIARQAKKDDSKENEVVISLR